MYVQRNTEVFLCYNCCSGKALIITYSVALGMQRAMGMPHIVICVRSASTVFIAHYLMNSRIFEKKSYTI